MEICKECKKEFKNLKGLSAHIRLSHFNIKIYYDKWIKNENENICKICHNENEFVGLSYGYKKGCCKQHMNIIGYECRKNALLKTYGVENQFQRKDVKEKIKENFVKIHGVKHQMYLQKTKDKIKKTCLKRYNVKHVFCKNSPVRKKWEQKLYNKYQITNIFQRDDIKIKIKSSNYKKYGVDNPMQNEKIFNKALKTRRLINKYKNTNLSYQGTYELDFLEKYYNKLDIENGPSIKYKFNGKNKVYHSDFYIPSKNLIVEIKSSYILTLDIEINEKKKACLKDYNYICIIDKNYEKFKGNYCT